MAVVAASSACSCSGVIVPPSRFFAFSTSPSGSRRRAGAARPGGDHLEDCRHTRNSCTSSSPGSPRAVLVALAQVGLRDGLESSRSYRNTPGTFAAAGSTSRGTAMSIRKSGRCFGRRRRPPRRPFEMTIPGAPVPLITMRPGSARTGAPRKGRPCRPAPPPAASACEPQIWAGEGGLPRSQEKAGALGSVLKRAAQPIDRRCHEGPQRDVASASTAVLVLLRGVELAKKIFGELRTQSSSCGGIEASWRPAPRRGGPATCSAPSTFDKAEHAAAGAGGKAALSRRSGPS